MVLPQFIWGGFIFHLSTISPQSFDDNSEVRWGSVPRINRRPGKQSIGLGDHKVVMTGTVYPLYNPGGGDAVVGTAWINILRAKSNKGEINLLIDGRGNNFGKFFLRDIQNNNSVLLDTSAPRKQGFTFNFERYGSDGGGNVFLNSINAVVL